MAIEEPDETGAPAEGDGDEPPRGVFGNLPQRRPGARSPRRQQGRGSRRQAGADAPGAAAEQPPTRAEPGPPPGREPAGRDEPAAPGAKGGGIEDVAWAGVAAAAEAATIGVRLATRALEAMRDAVDRR